MSEITLKSGAKLTIGSTPFVESKNLFQAVVKCMKDVEMDEKNNSLEAFVGALLGAQLSDTEIEKCLWVCMGRCTYSDGTKAVKIDMTIFEDIKVRMDFIDICLEVGKENLAPFMKALYVALPRLTEMIRNTPQLT